MGKGKDVWPQTSRGLISEQALSNFSSSESQYGEVDVLGILLHVKLALKGGVLQEWSLAVIENGHKLWLIQS